MVRCTYHRREILPDGIVHALGIIGEIVGVTVLLALAAPRVGAKELTVRFQFTVTTDIHRHATKLPSRVWLSGLWLMLQSDKGISSIRLAEASASASRRLGA